LSADEVASAVHLTLFKNDAAWHAAYADLKTVISDREHAERKP
jgi:hypothetical protein